MKFIKKLFFSYHNYKFRKNRNKNTFLKFDKIEIKSFYDKKIRQNKIILATQVGRGGGKWLVDIINNCNDISAFGERNRLEESLFRYNCSHNKFDKAKNILHIIKSEALSDWRFKSNSYISSPYFSHGIRFLEKNLNPEKIVIILRDFDSLLYSLLNKGWYNESIDLNLNKTFTKPPIKFLSNPSHFFGRYINFHSENKLFQNSSRSIKVAIFMHQTLKKIYEDILKIKKNKIIIFELNKADQNYKYCKSFLKKLNVSLIIDKNRFLRLKKRTSISYENEKVLIEKKDLKKISEIRNKYNYYLKKIKTFS